MSQGDDLFAVTDSFEPRHKEVIVHQPTRFMREAH